MRKKTFSKTLQRSVPDSPGLAAGALVTSDPAAGEGVFLDLATCQALEKEGFFKRPKKSSKKPEKKP